MKKIARFFASVKHEMKNIKWPTKKEMLKYSLATLVFIVAFALFFGATDAIVSGIKLGLKAWLG